MNRTRRKKKKGGEEKERKGLLAEQGAVSKICQSYIVIIILFCLEYMSCFAFIPTR